MKKRMIFHFNKDSLKDKKVPMWTIEEGKNIYHIDHVVSNVGFSTLNTRDHAVTQGSIVITGSLTIIEDNGIRTAHVS